MRLHLRLIGIAAGLSHFDIGQIVIDHRLRTIISKHARRVGCLGFSIVSTYSKWMNDDDTSNRCHGVGCRRVIKVKWRRSLSLGEAKSAADSGSAVSPLQYMSKLNCFGENCPVDAVGYVGYVADIPRMYLCSQSVIATTPILAPGIDWAMD